MSVCVTSMSCIPDPGFNRKMERNVWGPTHTHQSFSRWIIWKSSVYIVHDWHLNEDRGGKGYEVRWAELKGLIQKDVLIWMAIKWRFDMEEKGKANEGTFFMAVVKIGRERRDYGSWSPLRCRLAKENESRCNHIPVMCVCKPPWSTEMHTCTFSVRRTHLDTRIPTHTSSTGGPCQAGIPAKTKNLCSPSHPSKHENNKLNFYRVQTLHAC